MQRLLLSFLASPVSDWSRLVQEFTGHLHSVHFIPLEGLTRGHRSKDLDPFMGNSPSFTRHGSSCGEQGCGNRFFCSPRFTPPYGHRGQDPAPWDSRHLVPAQEIRCRKCPPVVWQPPTAFFPSIFGGRALCTRVPNSTMHGDPADENPWPNTHSSLPRLHSRNSSPSLQLQSTHCNGSTINDTNARDEMS